MKILVTGGLGFIGINTAIRFAKNADNKIVLFDNLSKIGSIKNISVAAQYNNIKIVMGDMRSYGDIDGLFNEHCFDVVFHFAAQTAVTISTDNPTLDFESNAVGTFNLLEVMRKRCHWAKLIYSSSNKVYGDLSNRILVATKNRYNFVDTLLGIDENEPLDFFSPYGCSKGCADQYVRDYARTYGLHTTVVRQSCIYGEYQDGTEDQGWVAWFIKAVINDIPITIYGDGKQVRDILYIDDLVDLYELIIEKGEAGEIYNAGGGVDNSISLLELIDILAKEFDKEIPVSFSKTRPGDQKIFISDNTKAEVELGWEIKTNKQNGLRKLIEYLKK